jgi:hypothetical protein
VTLGKISSPSAGELRDPVLHCDNSVAPGDLPLTVSAVTGKAIADFDRTENTLLCAPALEECIDICFGGMFALFIGHLARLFSFSELGRTGSWSPCLAAGN